MHVQDEQYVTYSLSPDATLLQPITIRLDVVNSQSNDSQSILAFTSTALPFVHCRLRLPKQRFLSKLKMINNLPSFRSVRRRFSSVIYFWRFPEPWSWRNGVHESGSVASWSSGAFSPHRNHSFGSHIISTSFSIFPGVIVCLTHWFLAQAHTRAFCIFLIAAPIAQFINRIMPYHHLLRMGTKENGIYHRTFLNLSLIHIWRCRRRG